MAVKRPTHVSGPNEAAMAMSTSALTRELEELVAALDRRVPRVEHAGEAAPGSDTGDPK